MKVTYGRLFNLGNFENERIELSKETDNPEETLKELKKKVLKLRKISEEEE